ncbi:MAG TPA: glycosyltransferase [Pseudomonadales bacterium]
MRPSDRQRALPGGPPTPPLVSVVVPVFNGARSLARAVCSLTRQTLSQLEVLIVDDGSTDDSVRVAMELAARDPRIRLLRHRCNRGQSAARNLALEQARGRWIAPVDADDEIDRERLRILVESGETCGADLIADGVHFAGPRQPGTPARLVTDANREPRLLTVEVLIESDIPLNGRCSYGYLKPLIRRSFLERWRLRYDEELRFEEDLNLYVRALLHGGRFLLHPQSLYRYNQTPVSASRDVQVLPKVVDQALVNSRRMREYARLHRRHDLDGLLDRHEQRWSTVLWFNRLKIALRGGRPGDVLQTMLDCPSGLRGLLLFARDRARSKAQTVL